MTTPLRKHLEMWNGCTRCELHETRQRMVFTRGPKVGNVWQITLPCDVVFVGEAPGESENSIGKPFVGPAGIEELDPILEKSFRGFELTYALCNLICCIPLNETGTKTAEPDHEHIVACAPRLQDFIRIADPRLIVCLGNLAKEWLDTKYKKSIRFHKPIPMIHLIHPSAILRANMTQRELMRQRAIVTLTNALDDLVNPPPEKPVSGNVPTAIDDDIPF